MFWIDKKDFPTAFCVIWIAYFDSDLSAAVTSLELSLETEPTKYKTIHGGNDEFKFTLVNETGTSYQLFWVDYEGYAKSFGILLKEISQSSFKGHVWMLKNKSKSYVFTLGTELFAQPGCSVNIGSLKETN